MKMRVVYHGRNRQTDEPFIYYDNLIDMARDSDWLVIIAPGGKGTDKIVSREVLEALGPEGYLVNMARGTLVDEAALVELLQSGKPRRRGARCVREGADGARGAVRARQCRALAAPWAAPQPDARQDGRPGGGQSRCAFRRGAVAERGGLMPRDPAGIFCSRSRRCGPI